VYKGVKNVINLIKFINHLNAINIGIKYVIQNQVDQIIIVYDILLIILI